MLKKSENKVLQTNVILILFERSWGEVDWILPVLFELKKIKPDWKIIIIFSDLWKKYNPDQMNRTLDLELKKIADNIVYFDKKIVIPGINSPDQVKIIIKDNGSDSPFKLSIQNAFPSAKIIAHPHHTTQLLAQRYNHPRSFNEWEKSFFKHDALLISKRLEATYFYNVLSNPKIGIVGFPRYDKWWIDVLLNSQEFKKSEEYAICSKKKRVFLFASRWVTREAPADVIDYVKRSVAEVILKDKENFLLIKPHPREKIETFHSYLSKYNPNQWMVSNLHSIQLASISDLAISVWSSVVHDILRLGKPVIEFFRFVTPNSTYEVDQEGRLTSISNLLGFSVLAETKEQLISYVNNFFDKNADHSIWHGQKEAFRKFCPPDNNASNKTARLIYNLFDEKDSKDNIDLPFIQKPDSLISGEKQLFLEKNQIGEQYLNLQLKRIKACGMPVSSVLLHELKNFFDTEIFVMTGTFNEYMANIAAQIFKEVHKVEFAADLYQVQQMDEIKKFDNIKIYNSSLFLKLLLPNIKGKILFFLSIHDNTVITVKSKTNYPIIEEIKAIKESNVTDAVILINNIRYFYPIKINEHEAQSYRRYPTFNDVLKQIMSINPKYRFAILGDIALAYPGDYPVSISQSVAALTLSRTFDGNNFDVNAVLNAEKYLSDSLSETEKNSIHSFHKDYFSYEEPGVGGYFRLWKGLTMLGDENYIEAKQDFLIAYQLGCNHWRILWYLTKSAFLSGDIDLCKEAIDIISKEAPYFEPAKNLKKQINLY